jgi:FAD/FMN-containing dehydrogenase
MRTTRRPAATNGTSAASAGSSGARQALAGERNPPLPDYAASLAGDLRCRVAGEVQATHDHATLGGTIGNDSCGTHSVMAGKTADNIDELDIVTYDGLRMRAGPTPEDELEKVIVRGTPGGHLRQAEAHPRHLRRRDPHRAAAHPAPGVRLQP